jgi:rare lipoprotein A (peptidoglycan hydrolase)
MIKAGLCVALLFAPVANPVVLGEPQNATRIVNSATKTNVSKLLFEGIATWYDATNNDQTTWYTRSGIEYYGAIGATLRSYKQHFYKTAWPVRITSLKTGKSVVVQVVDECTCYGVRNVIGDEPLIDLSPAVWHALGVSLAAGIMKIELQILP